MRQLFRRIGLAAAFLAASLAASPAREAVARTEVAVATPATAPARPAMWRVADHDTTIYLFGTIHALPPGIDWFHGTLANAFEGSHELVTEIVETTPGEMQSAVLARAMLPEGKTLRGLLTEPQRADYEATLKTYKIPPEALDRFKPWYAAVFLSALPVLRDGYASENGVEALLDARAKARKHPHRALETAEYQLGLFDSLPEAVQLRYLTEVIRTMPEATNELAAMVEAWKRGDADTLARLINEEESAPELMELLLTNRNRAWAEWIAARLDKPGVVFMAVGAGHLAGEQSVQAQLAARGIASSRVQ
jgi:uncharacterized protein